MINILYISMVLPYHNVASGGGKTFYHYIKGIQDDPDFNVTLLAKQLPGEKFDDLYLGNVSYCCLVNQRLSIRHPYESVLELWSKINPFHRYGNTLRESIYRQIRTYLKSRNPDDIDVIVLEFTEMALLAPEIKKEFPNAVILASEHDVTFLGRKRAYQTADNFFHKILLYIKYKIRKKNELYALRYCDIVMPHNPKDKKLLVENGITEEKIFVLTPYFCSNPILRRPNRRDILFYGAMGRKENCEAVIWFLDKVMPRLYDLDIRLVVLGANPQQSILNRQSEHVVVTGFVEDITPYFESCMCMIAPLQNGAGIKIKVLEALAAGIPVLTNEIGIEGIAAEPGHEYIHCDKPEDYESSIRAMVDGTIALQQISSNAVEFMRKHYNLGQALEDYKNCIKEAVDFGMKKKPLLNTYVNNLDMDEAVQAIEKLIENGGRSYVVAINVDVVMKIESDPYLKEIIDNANLTLVDGKPLIWISNFHKNTVKAKISGSDLVPILCKAGAKAGYSIFIIGGKEGVAQKAKMRLEQENPNIKIVGTYAPPIGFEKDEAEINKINEMITEAHPDLLIACFGCPKQEKWIYENYKKYDAKVSVCAGATVDFMAGNVRRAPRWMSEHGLEWFYRFLQEPKRMFKRYFIDDIKIVKLIIKYKNH